MLHNTSIPLETERLTLVAATRITLLADLQNGSHLASALKVTLPKTWPPSLGAGNWYSDLSGIWLREIADPTLSGMQVWYIISRSEETLIGAIWFATCSASGNRELWIEIDSDFEKSGYGAEALSRFLLWAFENGHDYVYFRTSSLLVQYFEQKCRCVCLIETEEEDPQSQLTPGKFIPK